MEILRVVYKSDVWFIGAFAAFNGTWQRAIELDNRQQQSHVSFGCYPEAYEKGKVDDGNGKLPQLFIVLMRKGYDGMIGDNGGRRVWGYSFG